MRALWPCVCLLLILAALRIWMMFDPEARIVWDHLMEPEA